MDWLTLVATALISLALYIAVQRWFQKAKSCPPGTRPPPGPPGRPFEGHTQFTAKDFHCNQAMKWTKQYGPVYRIKAGSADIVILNNFETIRKFLKKKEVLYRPQKFLFTGKEYAGACENLFCLFSSVNSSCDQVLRHYFLDCT
ncbi:hypothetical protein HPB48_008101 [Haemaphysalis longicornis]|uniref:Cytochrome P450 n=1 Tax=Haemaphysalis longicornis TaxID=44386 RepID=A0A9J6GFV3_HAELO|nr:hypothetical protein HPB48_008101 [Haemaphysalis longicornis]